MTILEDFKFEQQFFATGQTHEPFKVHVVFVHAGGAPSNN